ncbi:hypothetical protein G112A_00386 [Candidatus Nanosynsacchari sp. TM7_G1_3_12Alb]|nr:hypothetical protein G112A_00386 [Candidatus Nanosynsacchari sp. TM7_G1_3_12Alb]
MEKSNWSEPMGGCDSEGNPITVSFGSGPAEGEVWLGDGDRSGGVGIGGGLADGATHYLFFESSNHDHYGSGNGSNDNGTSRGQYTGPGH